MAILTEKNILNPYIKKATGYVKSLLSSNHVEMDNGETLQTAIDELNSNLGFELGTNYIKYNNGFLVQWGTDYFSTGLTSSTFVIDMPVAFVNNLYNVQLTKSSNGHAITNLCQMNGSGNSVKTVKSFTVTGYFNTTNYTKYFDWLAIGRWK